MGALGETFDWPVPITMMLSLAAGITVSISGNKLLFKNADGIEIGSKTLSDADLKIVEQTIEGENYSNLTEVVSAKEAEVYLHFLESGSTDKILPQIEDWQNRPLDEVYPILYIAYTELLN